jgi:hypothetical protein
MRWNVRSRVAACVVLLSLIVSGSLFGPCFYAGVKIDPALRFMSREPDVSEAVPACKIEYALGSNEVNDVVFVGDSGGACAFDPIEFQRACGDTAYNLCSEAGLGPVGYLITLKAYLDHHPQTKAVVLCVTPVTMERTAGSLGGDLQARFMKHYEPEIGTVGTIDRFLYFSRVGLESHWSPYDSGVLEKPLKYFESETYSTLRRKFEESRGFNRLIAHGGKAFKPGPSKEPPILDEWTQAVRVMAMLCEQRRVLMFVMFSPVRKDMKDARTFKPLESWCDAMSAQPSMCVLKPAVLFYDDSQMWDSTHAGEDGARQFSRHVAQCFDGVLGVHLNAAGVARFMPIVAKDVQQAIAR